MKLRSLLLIASVAANVVFAAALLVRPSLAPPQVRAWFESEDARRARLAAARDADARVDRERRAASTKAAAASQRLLWSALRTEDLQALVARLRAAGFPPAVVRAVVSSEIERRFSTRIKSLQAQAEETPYWQPSATRSNFYSKFFEERQQVYRDRTRLLREVLGDEFYAGSGLDPTEAQRRQFGNLSKAKIDLLQRINDDYAEMTAQIRMATAGIVLPEDRAKLALLEREKQADLAAVLSPQEFEDYTMRTSQITSRLRAALTLIDASEQEFRTIYRLSQPYADVLYPDIGDRAIMTADGRQKREDSQRALDAQLKSALGDARFAEWTRAQNYEFQQLVRITQQQNLPTSSAISAFDLRAATTAESATIGNDAKLSPEQRLAALRDLAQKTRNQLVATLGPAGASYAKSATWLQAIESGHAVTAAADGRGMSFRLISPTPPTPPTPPASR